MKGDLAPGSQLPSEPDLAKALQVSRSTLRAALSSLELRGLVVRKPGVGTFVTPLELFQNNLNQNSDVSDLIQSMGHKPGVGLMKTRVMSSPTEVSSALSLESGTPVVEVVRVRTADGRPVVYEEEYFQESYLKDSTPPMSLDALTRYVLRIERLYAILDEYLGRHVVAGQARLIPVVADKKMSSLLEVQKGAPLLHIKQVDFDREHRPILLSFEYHVCDLCRFSVYRSF